MKFPVVLHTDDNVRYGVTVPDLPGCFSAGDTFDEALESVKESIDLHLEGLTEEGGDIAIPKAIAEHQRNPDYADGIWAVVAVDTSRFEGKAEKINITVPRRILMKIDDYVKTHGTSRSGFLVEAAQRVIEGRV